MKSKIFIKRLVSFLLVFTLAFAALSGFSLTTQAADTYTILGVTLPLAKYPDGGRSYGKDQCWAFAAMVYKTVWGQSITSYRGTQDDMLRDVETGKARAITAENTRAFIEQAPLGSNIRIADSIKGNDTNGNKMHSQVLIQKDNDGLTVYESINKRIRIKYYTWEQYAIKHAGYKYFKYIKFPVPAEEPQPEEILMEARTDSLDNTANTVKSVIDFEKWSEWLLTGKVYPDVLYM